MKKRRLVFTILSGIAAIGLLVFVTVAFIGPALAPKPQRVEEPLNPTATDYPGIRNQPSPWPSITPLSYLGAPPVVPISTLAATQGVYVQQGQTYTQDPAYEQIASAFHALRNNLNSSEGVEAFWDTILTWAAYFRSIDCPMQEGSVWGIAAAYPDFAKRTQVSEGLNWTINKLNMIGWDHKPHCVVPNWLSVPST